jgi:hypothetical protein
MSTLARRVALCFSAGVSACAVSTDDAGVDASAVDEEFGTSSGSEGSTTDPANAPPVQEEDFVVEPNVQAFEVPAWPLPPQPFLATSFASKIRCCASGDGACKMYLGTPSNGTVSCPAAKPNFTHCESFSDCASSPGGHCSDDETDGNCTGWELHSGDQYRCEGRTVQLDFDWNGNGTYDRTVGQLVENDCAQCAHGYNGTECVTHDFDPAAERVLCCSSFGVAGHPTELSCYAEADEHKVTVTAEDSLACFRPTGDPNDTEALCGAPSMDAWVCNACPSPAFGCNLQDARWVERDGKFECHGFVEKWKDAWYLNDNILDDDIYRVTNRGGDNPAAAACPVFGGACAGAPTSEECLQNPAESATCNTVTVCDAVTELPSPQSTECAGIAGTDQCGPVTYQAQNEYLMCCDINRDADPSSTSCVPDADGDCSDKVDDTDPTDIDSWETLAYCEPCDSDWWPHGLAGDWCTCSVGWRLNEAQSPSACPDGINEGPIDNGDTCSRWLIDGLHPNTYICGGVLRDPSTGAALRQDGTWGGEDWCTQAGCTSQLGCEW